MSESFYTDTERLEIEKNGLTFFLHSQQLVPIDFTTTIFKTM